MCVLRVRIRVLVVRVFSRANSSSNLNLHIRLQQPFAELVSYMTSDWRKSFRGSQRSVNNEGGSFQGSRRSVNSEGGLVEKREPSSSQIEGARNGVQGGGAAELIEKREPSSSQTEGPRNGVRGGGMAEGISGDSNRPETRNSTSQPPVLLQESEAHSDDAFMESAVWLVAPCFGLLDQPCLRYMGSRCVI